MFAARSFNKCISAEYVRYIDSQTESIIRKLKLFSSGFLLLCRTLEILLFSTKKAVEENDFQLEELLDELADKNHMLKVNYPNFIPLVSSKKKPKYCKSQQY